MPCRFASTRLPARLPPYPAVIKDAAHGLACLLSGRVHCAQLTYTANVSALLLIACIHYCTLNLLTLQCILKVNGLLLPCEVALS